MVGVGKGAEQDGKGQSTRHRQDAQLMLEQPWRAVLARLTAGQHGGPQPWGLWRWGLVADVLSSSMRPQCRAGPTALLAAAVALTGSDHGVCTVALCPRPLPPPPLSVLSAGQRLTLLAFTPRLSASLGSSGRCAGSPLWPRPCCSSGLALGLALLLGDGDVLAVLAIPARHFPCRGTLPSLCHILCPSIMSLQRVLCPHSVSLPSLPATCPMSPQHARCPCILARGWHGCPLSGLWFGSSAPPGLPKVAVVNALVGHCDFMSAPSRGGALLVSAALSPLGSPGAVGKLGTHAGRAWSLRRVAVAAWHVVPWPGSPAASSPPWGGDHDRPTSCCPTGQDGGADSGRGGLVRDREGVAGAQGWLLLG